ncbi:glycerate kinase [Ornithinimicrobium pekingense]|uniref:Glycerate kinase n=1 Tax=Ornithinimicrobium pekingense TaxID=384677 RepID=A0ABQ2F8Z0_9MICO|nr:glycerate kinase [Ornithinimicrobium pekingense]GGK69247.1 glycerate kinase [Ornithinimicrobium pekingense]
MTRPAPRVVVVAEGCGDLPPVEAAHQVGAGWSQRAPHADVEVHASSSGAAGFAEVVGRTLRASFLPVVVPGPRGEEVPASLALVRDDDGAGGTAYLDTAQVCGRHLVGEDALLDPAGMTSAGVGRLLALARETGVERIVVGVGPLACHDGGVGLLRELGAGDDLEHLPAVRRDWSGTRLVLATTTEGSLLGFHGASATLTERHGVAPEVSQRLETELGELTDRVNQLLPPARDLLTGLARRPEREQGSGAGGGVGYALQLLGARTDTAPRLLLDELGIRRRLPGALLVLVTDAYDQDTVHEGVVADTARAALETATPTVVLARSVSVGRREGMSLGVSGSYELRPGEDLPALAARVARTWTPPPPATPPPGSAAGTG